MRTPLDLFFESVDGVSEPAQEYEAPEQHVHQHNEQRQQRELGLDFRPKQVNDGDCSLLQNEDNVAGYLKNRFIGTVDQGTTSSRFIIFDCTGVPIAKHQTEFRQIHEHPGYVSLPLYPTK